LEKLLAYYPYIYKYFLRRLRFQQEEAADCTQAFFEDYWKRRAAIGERISVAFIKQACWFHLSSWGKYRKLHHQEQLVSSEAILDSQQVAPLQEEALLSKQLASKALRLSPKLREAVDILVERGSFAKQQAYLRRRLQTPQALREGVDVQLLPTLFTEVMRKRVGQKTRGRKARRA
jgi:hypothetical protein